MHVALGKGKLDAGFMKFIGYGKVKSLRERLGRSLISLLHTISLKSIELSPN